MLNVDHGDAIELRDLDSSDLKLTPPTIEDNAPPRERPVRKEQRREMPKPQLVMTESTRKVTARLSASLNVGFSDFAGDFELSFATVPQEEARSAELADERGPVVFNLNEVDRKPRALIRIAPLIPYEARVKNIEGHVKVVFTVSESGTVADIRVVESVPTEIFEDAARAAVARWRFEPALKNGEPVNVKVMTRLVFELK
jgi:protein TonB